MAYTIENVMEKHLHGSNGITFQDQPLIVLTRARCGVDEITLWHGMIKLESGLFSEWSWISGTTPSAPILTC
jgi:hypothetical protein